MHPLAIIGMASGFGVFAGTAAAFYIADRWRKSLGLEESKKETERLNAQAIKSMEKLAKDLAEDYNLTITIQEKMKSMAESQDNDPNEVIVIDVA